MSNNKELDEDPRQLTPEERERVLAYWVSRGCSKEAAVEVLDNAPDLFDPEETCRNFEPAEFIAAFIPELARKYQEAYQAQSKRDHQARVKKSFLPRYDDF